MCLHLPSTGSFFKSRQSWALPQRFWFSLLGGGQHLHSGKAPQATDARALLREELLQTIWLKILKMPQSRQIGKRHLKGHTGDSREADSAKCMGINAKGVIQYAFRQIGLEGLGQLPYPRRSRSQISSLSLPNLNPTLLFFTETQFCHL